MLESSRRPADFLWLLFVACTVLIILSPLSPAPFLSSPLSFSLVYLWSRLNPNVRLSLFGVVQVPSTPRRRPADRPDHRAIPALRAGDLLVGAQFVFLSRRRRRAGDSDRALRASICTGRRRPRRFTSSTTSGTRSARAAAATGSRRPKCCAFAVPQPRRRRRHQIVGAIERAARPQAPVVAEQ